MAGWWEETLRYSRRDQLSVNVALDAARLPVNRIEVDNSRSEWHHWPVATRRDTATRTWNAAARPRPPAAELQLVRERLSDI